MNGAEVHESLFMQLIIHKILCELPISSTRTAEAPAIACPELAPLEAQNLAYHVRRGCALGGPEGHTMSEICAPGGLGSSLYRSWCPTWMVHGVVIVVQGLI